MFLLTPCMECCGHANSMHSEKKAMKGRIKNHHGTVGKLSLEQQFHKSDTETCCFV